MPRESSILTFTLPHLLWAVLPALSLQAVVGGQLQSICASAPDLQVLDQSIAHFDCSVNETVHALNCSYRGIPALPSTDDTAVPVGVEIFDFSHNRIKCLPKINNTRPTCSVADCHVGCLLELRLQHNEIEYLHEEVFLNLTCLRSLDLSHNAITNQTLQRNHFFRLSRLQHLDLHGNPLHTLPDNVLISAHLSHLHTLNLSSCQLQEIGQVAIDDFFEMEVLDLSRNQLSWLSSRTFQGLTSLRILDLRWNMLEVIENDTFADMRNLQELRLDHNRLVSIGELAFHRYAALQTVGALDNMLTALPYRALATLKTLRRLDLSNNPIQVLEPSHTPTSVQELRLDNLTALTRVKDDAFSAFPLLTTLSLRFTGHLHTLPPNAFRGSTQHLREVELDHGALQFLPQELLPWGQLRLVTLHGNDWHCDCRMAWASGHTPGNATFRCSQPVQLRGQTLADLKASDLSCPVSTLGVQVVMALSLTALFLAALGLVLSRKRRGVGCWCLRGDQVGYVTVFTRDTAGREDDEEEVANGTCGEGEGDDLDLGSGEGVGREEGRVRILVKSFRKGYSLLKNQGGESSQNLTSACDV